MTDSSIAENIILKAVNGFSLKAIIVDLINYCNTTFLKSADLDKKADKANVVAGIIGTKSATEGYELQIPWFEVNSDGLITDYGTHTHTVDELFIRNADGTITPKAKI